MCGTVCRAFDDKAVDFDWLLEADGDDKLQRGVNFHSKMGYDKSEHSIDVNMPAHRSRSLETWAQH